MGRLQSRRSNGRWRRNTLANMFGLEVVICPKCHGCNPYRLRPPEPVPTTCGQCGAALSVEEDK
jgi:hypothetical protein